MTLNRFLILMIVTATIFAFIAPLSHAQAQHRLIEDDAGRKVLIPENPIRIVSLDDADLTVPLLELGVTPVASQGRLGADRSRFLRSSRNLTGLDFDNTDMTFLGMTPVDVERIALVQPDLIITLKGRPTPFEQLQAIAPTIVIDDIKRSPYEVYSLLADLTGRKSALDALETRYRAQVAQLRNIAGEAPPSVSVIAATNDGKISVENTYGSIGLILRDANFPLPDLTNSIPKNTGAVFSPEALPEFDADIIFDTFRNDKGETAAHAQQRISAIMPDYCRFLRACKNNQYYFLPRDETKSVSYAARTMMFGVIVAALARSERVE